jgi:UDP-N-acetylmuramoyl-tripeptide--D-alanyl-D-alanine ligase
MNHPGEIEELTNIAYPEHGIITNIGPAHIEFMKSLENIFLEKSTLYKAVIKNSNGEGMFVVNADDACLVRLEPSNGLTTFGELQGEVRIKISSPNIEFTFKSEKMWITNKNIFEHHNLKNLFATLLLSLKLYPDRKVDLLAVAANYEQPKMNRSQWLENIFLDAYNANPSSMRVSLNSFIDFLKQKEVSIKDCYFVIGDMNELGEFASELHQEIAEYLKSLGVCNLTFIGRYRNFYLKGFNNPTSQFLTKEEFHEEWKTIRNKYKYIFIKASRSLQLETLISIV